MYTALMILSRQKCKELSYYYLNLVLLRLNSIEKLKRYKSPGIVQSPSEVMQAGGKL
jgi:hypothetical protein